jgi:putative hydrolase of the HAD superfamily
MSNLCVTFDLDDTLYLERDYVRSGFQAVGKWVSRSLGVSCFEDNAWALFEHGARGSIFQTALQNLGVDSNSELVREMVHIYRNHEPEIALLPDSKDCLERLRGRAVLGIVTDGPVSSQRAKCKRLNLERYCSFIVFTGEWGVDFYKPHIRGFEAARNLAGGGDLALAYVADNPTKDFSTPRRLGWDTVRVRRPGGLHFQEEAKGDSGARIEIRDLSPLCALFLASS